MRSVVVAAVSLATVTEVICQAEMDGIHHGAFTNNFPLLRVRKCQYVHAEATVWRSGITFVVALSPY